MTLSSSIPTRANYNFLGWGISATATTIAYPPGGTYVQNSSITLYAIWEIAFIPPRVNNFSAFRCTSDGTASDSGTYFKVSFNWTTDKPLSSIKVRWKTASGTIWTNSTIAASGTIGTASSVFGSGAISVDNSYDVEVIVTDTMGSTPTKAIVPGRLYPIDVLGGGHGVSIGKPAEIQDCFDVVWDIREKGTRLEDKYMKMADWLNVVYPVNSIYITFSHTSPANLFGGTWTRLSSYFLYGTGAGGVIGETGGSTSHTLTIDEMPSHRHDATLYAPERAAIGSSDYWAAMYDKSQTSIHTTYVGGGKAFEIVPPFIKVSIWRRVS